MFPRRFGFLGMGGVPNMCGVPGMNNMGGASMGSMSNMAGVGAMGSLGAAANAMSFNQGVPMNPLLQQMAMGQMFDLSAGGVQPEMAAGQGSQRDRSRSPAVDKANCPPLTPQERPRPTI